LRNGSEGAGGTDYPDTALGDAFDVGLGGGERKDDQSYSTPASAKLFKKPSVMSQEFRDKLLQIQQRIITIENSVSNDFTSPYGTSSEKFNKLNEHEYHAKKLTSDIQDLNNELQIDKRSQADELRTLRKRVTQRIWDCVDDITKKIKSLQ
jgi:hypothetical protein